MSETEIKAKFEAIKVCLLKIETEIKACKQILSKGEKP